MMKLKQMSPQIDAASLEMRRDVKYMRAVLRKFMTVTMVLLSYISFADVTVSDVQVFSGHPWKEVVIGYTITGNADKAYSLLLTATDKSAKKTYTAQTLEGARLAEGRHVLRWDAAADGARFSSKNVVFSVSIVAYGGVQLWEDGPYWAECNVGATKPEEYGYCFWWGDTVGYKRNSADNGWISVKDGTAFSFGRENCPTYGKSKSQLQSAGYIDSTGNLVSAHDAAMVHLGAPWRTPTDAEFAALISNCDMQWTTRGGVYGRLVTGRGAYASKSIFLPAAGYGWASNLLYGGEVGWYWSSTPNSDNWYCAFGLEFSSGNHLYRSSSCRADGQSVRPLRDPAK